MTLDVIGADKAFISVPSSVSVGQGDKSTTFTIKNINASHVAELTVTATYAGVSKSVLIRLPP